MPPWSARGSLARHPLCRAHCWQLRPLARTSFYGGRKGRPSRFWPWRWCRSMQRWEDWKVPQALWSPAFWTAWRSEPFAAWGAGSGCRRGRLPKWSAMRGCTISFNNIINAQSIINFFLFKFMRPWSATLAIFNCWPLFRSFCFITNEYKWNRFQWGKTSTEETSSPSFLLSQEAINVLALDLSIQFKKTTHHNLNVLVFVSNSWEKL